MSVQVQESNSPSIWDTPITKLVRVNWDVVILVAILLFAVVTRFYDLAGGAWSHDRAAWTVEAKFLVNDFGLRNRFAIITETPGQPTFERRIYAHYAYITALLQSGAAEKAQP